MQLTLLISISLVAVTQGFTGFRAPVSSTRFSSGIARAPTSALRMSDEPSVELVPLEKTNIENSAAVTGGVLGFVLAGPIAGILFAAVTNYVVKKEDDSGEALRGLGKTVIESWNFVTKLNAKYDISTKISETVKKSLDSSDSEALTSAREAYSKATIKVTELNKQYDLVGKGKEVLVTGSVLSDAAIDKVMEMNDKYDFVETAKKTANTVVKKVKDSTA